jgi:hypothetical protein
MMTVADKESMAVFFYAKIFAINNSQTLLKQFINSGTVN